MQSLSQAYLSLSALWKIIKYNVQGDPKSKPQTFVHIFAKY